MSLRVMLNHRMKSKHLLIRSQTSSFNSAENGKFQIFLIIKKNILQNTTGRLVTYNLLNMKLKWGRGRLYNTDRAGLFHR